MTAPRLTLRRIAKGPTHQGAALLIVLAMVVIIVGLVITAFISVTAEQRAASSKLRGIGVLHLAASAPQLVISQIQDAADSGNAWSSQPGMIRTYSASGPEQVYKLYSALEVVEDASGFTEDSDLPPSNWNVSTNHAVWCDLNQPKASSNGALLYPIADPSTAADSFSTSGEVPGYHIEKTLVPGFNPSATPSPTNNVLPMPVRWLYVLKDGRMAVPQSVAGDGVVTFSNAAALPTRENPVVGRIAYWSDDDTSKININTAGYARNDNDYWTFWDTPFGYSSQEQSWLSGAQPWTNEFQRYPGHPATTGLNVVFDSLSLSDEQILSLTPKFVAGGTEGGTVRRVDAPSASEIAALRKDDRLFPSVDEMFYSPVRGANTAGILRADLEARRFFLTANSRAPEVTVWNTPRVTIWPTWEDPDKRTPIDRLIAFTSTLAGQRFFFTREDPLSTRELLDFPGNLSVWNYLASLSGQPVPGFGGTFAAKYGASNRDQILTSIFDAIRLANLDDRTGAGNSSQSGWSFTAGELRLENGEWVPLPSNSPYTGGYVAPTEGPNGTRAPGRTSALAEVAVLFARPSGDTSEIAPTQDVDGDGSNDRVVDQVRVAVLYGFYAPAAGFIQPGQNRRIRVSGLSGFTVSSGPGRPEQQIFPNDVYDRTEVDGANVTRRELGGRMEWTVSQMPNPPGVNPPIAFGPPTGNVILPIDLSNPDAEPFTFSEGTLTIEVFSPANAPAPYQTYSITFPEAQVLPPLHVQMNNSGWVDGQRWMRLSVGTPNLWEQSISIAGDSLIAMQSPTGDFRSEVLRDGVIADFQPHSRYGEVDLLTGPMPTFFTSSQLSRRASSLQWSRGSGETVNFASPPGVLGQLFGRLLPGFDGFASKVAPVIPSHFYPQSISEAFPPGDFSTGPGPAGFGSLSPKTDEGAWIGSFVDPNESPYFRRVSNATRDIAQSTLASPNRQLPSAVYFGSIASGSPWRTLLFRPARSYHPGGSGHFGGSSPPDCLMLDWFNMPVVEPYAISEPFSTAGKVNLNASIIPFADYMRRETALHAVLRSTRIAAVPESLVGSTEFAVGGQTGGALPAPPSATTRYPINVQATLDLLRRRAENTDGTGLQSYLTNAEVCLVDLVPEGFSAANIAAFWADKRTTGDNLREAAYSSLLPRLTARSNTFTVHVAAQALQSSQSDGGWREGRGEVAAEWRGSYSVERYIDPEDLRFRQQAPPDFLSGTVSVEPFYKYRVLGERRFSP